MELPIVFIIKFPIMRINLILIVLKQINLPAVRPRLRCSLIELPVAKATNPEHLRREVEWRVTKLVAFMRRRELLS
jgi:hypothetical protein